MSLVSGLVIGVVGVTSTVAAIVISTIIVLVLSQAATLAYRHIFPPSSQRI